MKIAIDLINVNDEIRIRKEIGNLQPLVDSIRKVGLLNPILIDEQSNLIAGYRRLQACKQMEMEEVEVKIVEFGGDMLKKLDVEIAENFFRKDFTPQEVLASEMRRQEIIESTREKGVFERFWLWLKGLFSSEPATTPKTPQEASPSGEEAFGAKAEKKEQMAATVAEDAPAQGVEPTGETPKTGNTAADQDERSIKWRAT